MTDKDPIAPPVAAALRRHWQAPRVRRLVATSAENAAAGSTDSSENLS